MVRQFSVGNIVLVAFLVGSGFVTYDALTLPQEEFVAGAGLDIALVTAAAIAALVLRKNILKRGKRLERDKIDQALEQ